MDCFGEESREEKVLEDYLFGGYRPSDSTFDQDQQFARPIEDEDLFGNQCHNELSQNGDEIERQLVSSDGVRAVGCAETKNSVTEGKMMHSGSQAENQSHYNIDEVFKDDYSLSSSEDLQSNLNQSNDENTKPKNYTVKQPPPPSPAQIRIKHMKESLLQQARELNVKPKKLASDFGEDGTIEMFIEQEKLKPDTNSKFKFDLLMNKSKKLARSPEELKKSWTLHKDALRKKICAQKRKVWDSLRKPTDLYDDEEQLPEAKQEDAPEQEGSNGQDEEPASENGDGDDANSLREDEDDIGFGDFIGQDDDDTASSDNGENESDCREDGSGDDESIGAEEDEEVASTKKSEADSFDDDIESSNSRQSEKEVEASISSEGESEDDGEDDISENEDDQMDTESLNEHRDVKQVKMDKSQRKWTKVLLEDDSQ